MSKMKELLVVVLEEAEMDMNVACDILIDRLGYKREYAYNIIDSYMEKQKK